MKKIISLGSILCSAMLMISCSQKENTGNTVWTTYRISAACTDVKTALSGREVIWQEGDKVSCLCHYQELDSYSLISDISPKSINGSSAEFEIVSAGEFIPQLLIYPSSAAYRKSSDQEITLDIPSEVEAQIGNAPAQRMVSLGIINDGQVVMRNVMALLKFEIISEDISRIEVKAPGGEPLSGDVVIDIESLTATGGGVNYVSVIPAAEAETFAPGTYYIPVPAGEYSQGLSVRFENTIGNAAKKASSSAYTAHRNRIVNMGQESEWGLVFKPGSITKDIVFITENGAVFPFSDQADAVSAVTPPTTGSVAGKGEFGPFYLLGWPDMPFYFRLHNTSGEKNYFTSQGTYGLRMGGTIGDYMTLPAIDGFRLTSVTIEEGSASSYYAITDAPEDDSIAPTYLTSATITINKNTSRTFSFDDTKTSVSKPYRIVTGKTNPTSIKKITITYKNEE